MVSFHWLSATGGRNDVLFLFCHCFSVKRPVGSRDADFVVRRGSIADPLLRL